MKINDEMIEKLENLTMLKIKDKEGMKEKLGDVLTFMENLKAVEDVQNNEKVNTVYREDNESLGYPLEDFYEENPKVVDGSFEVPKII